MSTNVLLRSAMNALGIEIVQTFRLCRLFLPHGLLEYHPLSAFTGISILLQIIGFSLSLSVLWQQAGRVFITVGALVVHFAFITSPVLLTGHIYNLTQFLNIFKLTFSANISVGTVCHIDCVDCPLDSSPGLAIPEGKIERQFCIWQIPIK